MPTLSNYVAVGTAVYVLLGVISYIIDRKLGRSIYRTWYNWTHKNPLPEGVEKGFIYNQYTKNQVAVAIFLSVTFSVIAVVTMEVSWLVEFLVAFVESIAMMIGFKIGPWAYRVYEGKDKALDMIDKLERGEVNISDEIKDAATSVSTAVTEGAKGIIDEVVEGVKETVHLNEDKEVKEPQKEDPEEPEKVEPEESKAAEKNEVPSFEEALNKYKKGGNDGE